MSIDVDSWIEGAQRTHRCVTIYQRADLVAALDDLDRRIQVAKAAGNHDEANRLTEQWTAVAQKFTDSGLEITVRGLTGDEFKAHRAQAKLDKVDDRVLGARLLHAAIVHPKFTVDQLLRLQDKIGEPQVTRIVAAYVTASREQPPTPAVD